MTLSRVDPFTPTQLVDGYIAAIDQELAEIHEELERKRLEYIVLEDRQHQLRAIRAHHVDARTALTPPSTLHALVAEVDATT